jgi:dynein heavy chain
LTKRDQLRLVVEKVNELNFVMQQNKSDKKILEEQTTLCKKRLERAEVLIKDLGGEKTRWSAEADNLLLVNNTLIGDTLLSAGIVTYFGSFTRNYRQVKHDYLYLINDSYNLIYSI